LVERSALAVGLMAAAIAVGGFVTRAYAVLTDQSDRSVSRATVVGGLCALVMAILVIVIGSITG
jgi:cytochrome bd-type quinol oxidase subunit 1